MEDESELEQAEPKHIQIPTPYPPMPTGNVPILPKEAKMKHFPLRLSEPPIHKETTARAATLIKPNEEKNQDAECLPNRISRLDIIGDMQLDKDEIFNQVYLSPSPFHEAFEEKLDLRQWSPKNDHKAAGLSLIKDGDRLILGNIIKSSPAARIDKWRSRCRGAWLMEIDGTPVNNISQVHDILKRAKEQGK
eukprot:scaffold46036_cov19-Cyclotella_meneghiniana.AAC.1